MTSAIIGPIAPENNPPITPQYYEPSRFVISAISLGTTTLVTTSVNHNYVIGQSIRLLIPGVMLVNGVIKGTGYGSTQLSGQTGNVISIPNPNQVVVGINSTNSNAFDPSGTNTTQPQILAIGDVNSGQINSSGIINTGTFISGSFINISPQ